MDRKYLGACGSGEEDRDRADRRRLRAARGDGPRRPDRFEIENAGTSRVTEMEILDGEEVLGEEENITDGLDGSFSVALEAGKYTIYCPGGSDERGTLTVTGAKHVEGATRGEKDGDEGR